MLAAAPWEMLALGWAPCLGWLRLMGPSERCSAQARQEQSGAASPLSPGAAACPSAFPPRCASRQFGGLERVVQAAPWSQQEWGPIAAPQEPGRWSIWSSELRAQPGPPRRQGMGTAEDTCLPEEFHLADFQL